MSGFARCMMVKQFVGDINAGSGRWWRVFETGDPKYYLFDRITRAGGESTGLQIPILKTDLKRDVRQALRAANGSAIERVS